ncbi:unnamed protein product [Tetraodon nigroviridis]|uniref:Cilia- and flagella-associated protein HOATZ n=1 Tax=Tetraodon nigroviridis TaxID=99883 RepID=Q4SAT3_TETNG|nr:unnamed protein product [Tetraodon nigroviridis]
MDSGRPGRAAAPELEAPADSFLVFDGSSPAEVSHARRLWSSMFLLPPLESRLVSADIRQRLPVSRPRPPGPRPSAPEPRRRREERQRYADRGRAEEGAPGPAEDPERARLRGPRAPREARGRGAERSRL